jgi:hypothetical protein
MGGEGPIPYASISRYAADNGIADVDLWLFRTLMNVIDTEWLKHVAAEQKKREGENGR